jgi:hypothetical protein
VAMEFFLSEGKEKQGQRLAWETRHNKVEGAPAAQGHGSPGGTGLAGCLLFHVGALTLDAALGLAVGKGEVVAFSKPVGGGGCSSVSFHLFNPR